MMRAVLLRRNVAVEGEKKVCVCLYFIFGIQIQLPLLVYADGLIAIL